jgi:hypothetical protein
VPTVQVFQAQLGPSQTEITLPVDLAPYSEAQREERPVVETAAQLPPATRAALDALVKTQAPEKPADEDQVPLFPFFRFALNSPR